MALISIHMCRIVWHKACSGKAACKKKKNPHACPSKEGLFVETLDKSIKDVMEKVVLLLTA